MCSNLKAALALLAMPPLSGQGKGVFPFALHLDRGVCVGAALRAVAWALRVHLWPGEASASSSCSAEAFLQHTAPWIPQHLKTKSFL